MLDQAAAAVKGPGADNVLFDLARGSFWSAGLRAAGPAAHQPHRSVTCPPPAFTPLARACELDRSGFGRRERGAGSSERSGNVAARSDTRWRPGGISRRSDA